MSIRLGSAELTLTANTSCQRAKPEAHSLVTFEQAEDYTSVLPVQSDCSRGKQLDYCLGKNYFPENFSNYEDQKNSDSVITYFPRK